MKCYLCRTKKSKDGTPVKHYKCKECATKKQGEYYAKSPEKFRELKAKFRRDNPEKQKEYDRRARQKLKLDALEAYSNGKSMCVCCKEDTIDFLCLDHINNDGALHRKETGGGNSFYFWLRKRKYPRLALQVMCYNCNNSKKIKGQCIHIIEKFL